MTYRCPICGQPTDSRVEREFPFCSPRCRLVDLGQWAAEDYRVSEPAEQEFQSHSSHDDSYTS